MTRRTLARTLAVTLALPLIAALAIGVSLPLVAEETAHTGHNMSGIESEATMAFMAANMKMHQDMTVEFTGNPDADFIRGMIPHHQGAVDMARILLQYGSDPEVKKFAESVISAQEAEVTWMTDWLARNGG